jgi:hypothetical protein
VNDNIYPGHGACELCGEIDPCVPCAGAWIQSDEPSLLAEAQKRLNNLLEIKFNNNLREKVNSVLASVTEG